MKMTVFFTVLLFFFRLKTRRQNDDGKEETAEDTNLLCRFVVDGLGRKIGESVSLDEDIIIIKSGRKYLGVPLKHVEENGKNLLVKGLVDFRKAEELGEKWRQAGYSEIHDSQENEGINDGF
jgi:hypothetical protein